MTDEEGQESQSLEGSEEETQESTGSQTEEGTSAEERESQSEQDGQGSSERVELRYGNRFLDGRAPDEVGEMFGDLHSQLREMGAELNAMRRERESAPAAQPQPQNGGLTEDQLQEMSVTDPVGAMRVVLQQELNKAIEPFNRDRVETSRITARTQVRQMFDDWDEIEPYVDYLLRTTGQEGSLQNLQALYYSAAGMKERGVFDTVPGLAPPRPTSSQSGQSMDRGVPPQHRPSRAPLPQGEVKQEIELTEEERFLAKKWGMSPDEYKKYQDADPREVIHLETESVS